MYATKHYHEDNGEFMDDYRVGNSRGCGGLGIWDGTKLHVSSNYHNWKLITTGPVRSEFELTYDAWDAGNGRMVSETKRYSIDAGSLFSPRRKARFCERRQIAVAADRRRRPGRARLPDQPRGIHHARFGRRLAGLLAAGRQAERRHRRRHHSGQRQRAGIHERQSGSCPTPSSTPTCRSRRMKAIRPSATCWRSRRSRIGKPLTYYFGACWDRSGDFTNAVQWENYVKRFAERRDQPLQVTVGKLKMANRPPPMPWSRLEFVIQKRQAVNCRRLHAQREPRRA
jgi:hypothetical protein